MSKTTEFIYKPGKYLKPGELDAVWFDMLKPIMPHMIDGVLRIISQYSKPRYEYSEVPEYDWESENFDDIYIEQERNSKKYYTDWCVDYYSVSCGYLNRLVDALPRLKSLVYLDAAWDLPSEIELWNDRYSRKTLSSILDFMKTVNTEIDGNKCYYGGITYVKKYESDFKNIDKEKEPGNDLICFKNSDDIDLLKSVHHCAFFYSPMSVSIIEDNGYRMLKTTYDTESG